MAGPTAPPRPADGFPAIVGRLAALLKPYEKRFRVESSRARYALFAKIDLSRGRPFYMVWIEARKNYVSLHLIPIYFEPKLMEGASPALQRRKHGKACFNFTAFDAELERDVRALLKHVMSAMTDERLRAIADSTVERERAVKERAKQSRAQAPVKKAPAKKAPAKKARTVKRP